MLLMGCAQEQQTTTEATNLEYTVKETPTYGDGTDVFIIKGQFDPEIARIKVGDEVTWINRDEKNHSIIIDTLVGPVIKKGERYSHVFESAGQYDISDFDKGFSGKVIVE